MSFAIVLAAALATTPVSLEQVREASRANTQALLAALEAERAEEQVRLARSVIYPQVALNAGAGGAVYGRQRTFSTVPQIDGTGSVTGFTQRTVDVNTSTSRASFDLSLSVGQLIYDGGRWWAQIAQAGALAEAQQGQALEQQLASELEGVRRFYELLRAQEIERVLDANVQRSMQHLARAQALFEAGRGQRADVYAAQVNVGNDKLEVLRQTARIVNAQGHLAVWIVVPGTSALVASAPAGLETAPQSAPELDTALKVAVERRPILRAVADQLRAAESAVTVAASENLPSVSAQATAGRQGPSVDPFFTDPARQNYLQGGVNIRWDLFSGFATSAQVQQARIAERRVQLELAQAQRELEAEVRIAVVQLTAQIASVELARANLEAAKKGLEFAEGRFEAGAGSTLEVRDAQLKLTQAELSLLQTRIDVEIARAAVERVTGQGVQQ